MAEIQNKVAGQGTALSSREQGSTPFQPESISRDLPGSEMPQLIPQPELRSELPDVRMQLPGSQLSPEEQLKQMQDILDMQRQMGEYRTSSLEGFCRGLEALSKVDRTDVVRTEKIRKELQEKYEETLSQAVFAIEQIYDVVVSRNHNAYPYFTHPGEGFFAAALSQINESRDAKWMKEGSEAWAWHKRLERDISWAKSFFRVSVALSAAKPAYFDVILQLQTLKQQREFATTGDLIAVYAQKLPGLEFETAAAQGQSEPESAIIRQRRIGIKVPRKYTDKYGFSREMVDGVEGVREIAGKFQDESMAWRMRIAAASQFDHRKTYKESSFMGTNLHEEELRLIRGLLGVHKTEGGIEKYKVLNPFSERSKLEKQREISVTLQALLRTNAFDRVRAIIGGGGSKQDRERKVGVLSTDVKEMAESIQNNWEKKEKNDPVARLAKLITEMGYLQDFSLLTAYDYCWSFEWERSLSRSAPREEKEWHVKKVKTGGINGPSGDAFSLYWARRKHIYDQQWNSSAGQMLPTSRAGRKEVSTLPFNKMPKYLDYYKEGLEDHPDKFLAEQWKFLFSDDPRWKKARADMGYSDIPSNVKDVLMEWAFIWKTPFNAKFVGDGDYEIEIPHFAPAGLPIANMWDAVSTEEDEINHGAKSVWQQLIEGTKMSEVKWEKMDQMQVDRWLVDCEMASRFMRIFIEVVDKERDPLLSMLAGEPGTMPLRDLAKRIRLTFRDSKEAPPTMYEIAMIPWLVTLVTANKYGISGAGAWMMVGKESREENNCGLDRFVAEMALWERALKWAPGDRPELDSKEGAEYDYEDLKYGNTMALLAEFYVTLFVRMGKASAQESVVQGQDNFEKTSKRLNQYPFMSKGGTLSRKINELVPLVDK